MKSRPLIIFVIICLVIIIPPMISNHIQIVYQEHAFQYPPPATWIHTLDNTDHELIHTLIKSGCSTGEIIHLVDVSSILDKEFSGGYDMNLPGLPDDLLKEDYDKCVQIAISIRESNTTTDPVRLQRAVEFSWYDGYTRETIDSNRSHQNNNNGATQSLLKYCAFGGTSGGFTINNSTHYFDFESCKWIKHEN